MYYLSLELCEKSSVVFSDEHILITSSVQFYSSVQVNFHTATI